jgi:hypothetical protein
MKKKIVTSSFVLLAPALALAQTENKVSQGITKAVPYLVAIGMAVSVCGLIFAGIKFTSGDPSAKDQAKNVLVGSILIMSASAIGGLLKSWFGGG